MTISVANTITAGRLIARVRNGRDENGQKALCHVGGKMEGDQGVRSSV